MGIKRKKWKKKKAGMYVLWNSPWKKVAQGAVSWGKELRKPCLPRCFTCASANWTSLVSSRLNWTACRHQGKNYMGLQGIESCWLQEQNSLSYWKYANLLCG